MSLRVRVSARATEELIALQQWIADRAGRDTALDYIARIRSRCRALGDFPHQGTPRDDLVAGLRTVSFERRLVIGYRVVGDEVSIERIVGAAQDTGIWN